MTEPHNISLMDAISLRRSVRGFTKELVPSETIDKILTLAQQSPSNCNVQPWKVLLASDKHCDELREQLTQAFTTGKSMTPDFTHTTKFSGELRNRQVQCAQALYGAMGIERSDKAGRMDASKRNYEFFGAPHVLFITMQRDFSQTIAVDVGMYAQTLMLLMAAHGIASCAQASVAYYPQIIRDYFNEPSDSGILFGISFGYEDKSVQANQAHTNRADISEVVTIKD